MRIVRFRHQLCDIGDLPLQDNSTARNRTEISNHQAHNATETEMRFGQFGLNQFRQRVPGGNLPGVVVSRIRDMRFCVGVFVRTRFQSPVD